MAKSKKSKASTKAKRAASANKARQTLINKEIAKYEANKKRAKNLKKARKALVQKEVAKVEKKHKKQMAQARYSARAANRRAYAADVRADEAALRADAAKRRAHAASERAYEAEQKAAARSAENYKLHKELSRRKRPAGARVIANSSIWLAVGALVFAIIFIVLYWMVANDKGGSGFNHKDAQIAYTIFLIMMFATIIGLLVLVSPLWGTLRRENHSTPLAKASMIIIWLVCAFSLAVFIIDILTHAELNSDKSTLITYDDISENAQDILNYVSVGCPALLLLFSGLLYGSVKRSYPLV